jgi:hypothetical protein
MRKLQLRDRMGSGASAAHLPAQDVSHAETDVLKVALNMEGHFDKSVQVI